MLTRRRLIATFALLLPGSIGVHAALEQGKSAKPAPKLTTVTLLIDGMT